MKVVIIGAGAAGLGTGWRLRQAGVDVTVLERSQPARGATWAAAGMLSVAGELGRAQTPEAEFAYRSSLLWPAFATELEAASGMTIGYRRNGALIVARTQGEAAELEAGPGVERLTPAETREREPMLTGDLAAALWAPEEAQVSNRALGQALRQAFLKSGGTLAINEAVIRFEVEGDRVAAIRTPFRLVEADLFVIAAGAWSAQFEGLPASAIPNVVPVKGQMIAVVPPAGTPLPAQVIWGNDIYLVPQPDRLLIGATLEPDAGFDTRVTDIATEWLSSRAISLMPKLAVWNVIERWAGLRPGSPDGRPIMGRTSLENLMVASGQFRNGILMTPALAESMARLIVSGAAPEIEAFDPRR
ncbi:MAG TPA: glycine oxidase ThiO [Rhizomicrobium sp.]|nr:glycine oxidase ThiO [Rhizomicrobium sp.]